MTFVDTEEDNASAISECQDWPVTVEHGEAAKGRQACDWLQFEPVACPGYRWTISQSPYTALTTGNFPAAGAEQGIISGFWK